MSQTNTNREKKIRSILERSSNIDVQTSQKYLDKKLTKEELHEVEKQLLNSDFAAEAIEGFENADFKVNIAASTNALNKEIKKYNKERGFYKKDYRVFYAAASVVLIFAVLFGLFRLADTNFSSGNLAMESKSEATINQSITTKDENLSSNQYEIIPNEKDLITKLKEEEITEVKANKNSTQNSRFKNNDLALNQDKTEQDFSTSDIWITKREKIDNEKDEIISSNNLDQIIVSSPALSENTQMNNDSSITANTEQLADDDFIFFSESNKNKMARNAKSSTEILFDAMQSYENKKYTEAGLLFDSYLVTNPNNAQALYFGGVSYYENHDYKKVIPLLTKFLNQKSNIVYQKNHQYAEWLLANSYLNIKQKQKAKMLLQKIANSTSKYSNEAKSLLKK